MVHKRALVLAQELIEPAVVTETTTAGTRVALKF